MPGGNGTGPFGGGPMGGGGRMGGNRPGAGPAGFCVCPKCGSKVSHQRGVPCYSMKCPSCGGAMVRE